MIILFIHLAQVPPVGFTRFQILWESITVLRYHRQGCFHNILMAAVIRRKYDLFCPEFLYKLLHTGRFRSTEPVNRLIIISHCEYIFMLLGQ